MAIVIMFAEAKENIFQATCDLEERETAESLSKRVQGLEYQHFSSVIADVVGL